MAWRGSGHRLAGTAFGRALGDGLGERWQAFEKVWRTSAVDLTSLQRTGAKAHAPRRPNAGPPSPPKRTPKVRRRGRRRRGRFGPHRHADARGGEQLHAAGGARGDITDRQGGGGGARARGGACVREVGGGAQGAEGRRLLGGGGRWPVAARGVGGHHRLGGQPPKPLLWAAPSSPLTKTPLSRTPTKHPAPGPPKNRSGPLKFT